jgi:hypothetical protein
MAVDKMKCSNDDIRRLIPYYLTGEISDKDKSRIVEHIKKCSDCQDLVRDIVWLSNGLKMQGREILRDHISAETLVKYVDNPESLRKDAKEFIKLHLDYCSQCQSEYEILKDVNTEISIKGGGLEKEHRGLSEIINSFIKSFSSLVRKPIFAYSLAAAILIISVLPRVYFTTTAGRRGLTTEHVTILTEQTRELAKPVKVARNSKDPFVRIAIASYWPDPEDNIYNIAARNQAGEIMEEDRNFTGFGNNGFTQFCLNTGNWPDGTYMIRIRSANKRDSTDYRDTFFPFELITRKQ